MVEPLILSKHLAKSLGHSHLRIAGEYWHLSEILQLQALLFEHAPVLNEGLVWWAKCVSLLDRSVYVELQEQAEGVSLSLRCREQHSAPSWAENLLAHLYQQLQQRCEASQVNLLNAQSLWLAEAARSLSLAQQSELHHLAKKVLVLLMHQSIERPDLQTQLRRSIQAGIEQPLNIAGVAKQLGLSTRTLQRRLNAKQLNFSQLVEDEKKTLALNLLADTNLPVAQIALRLGYDDPANFHRSFRRWFNFKPSAYRRQCQQNRVQSKQMPVRLHYARGPIGQPGELHTQEGQVWLEVDNIAFEKVVSVECKDHDGIWRHYPAFFNDFLAEGTELWSTANLPVAQPLRFRLRYEVDGEIYVNDNQQQDYLVTQRLLLGAPSYIVPTLHMIKIGFAYQLFIELACRLEGVAQILCYVDELQQPLALQQVSSNSHYSMWSLSSPFPTLAKRCSFRLYDAQSQELATQHYPQYYQFVPPLA